MNEFTAKNKALHNALQEIFPAYIMASQDDDHTSVHVKGKATDLLYLTNQLVQSIRKEFRKEYDDELVEKLLATILKTPEEMEAEMEEMQEKKTPKWLRRLMELEDEEEGN